MERLPALDVVIIGAGPAGIAAARRCLAHGLEVLIVEARRRVGGRAHTLDLGGTPIDLGAHWMHMAEHNPLVPEGDRLGIEMIHAPAAFPYYVEGRKQTRAETLRLRSAWETTEANALERASAGADLSVAECLPALGEWTDSIAFNHGLYSGRAVEEVSAFDYARVEDSDNRFPRGGFGALVERLAEGLPIETGVAIEQIDWAADPIRMRTTASVFAASNVIVTVPIGVLQAGAIEFNPPLPEPHRQAIAAFRPAAYDHVILRWADTPFENGADQLTLFKGERTRNISMLTHIEGSDLHYVEIGGALMTDFKGTPAEREAFAIEAALGELRRHFGTQRTKTIEVAAVTNWWDDPWARGSWSVLPPGRALCREAMQVPVVAGDGAGLIAFAGEFASPSQWGTVGGAWLEGERAADQVADALRGASSAGGRPNRRPR